MFRNCLAAALRHLARNRLYTAVSVAGLAVGLCVALIAALVIRNQYTYDHFVPGYERTYAALVAISAPGLAKQYIPVTVLDMAAQLEQRSSMIQAARVLEDGGASVENGERKSRETVFWADANLPKVLPLPTYAGDVAAALQAANGLILSRTYARKFFGRDTPLGQTLLINGHPMLVRAVIQDPPQNGTHLERNIIAAGISSFAPNSRKAGAGAVKLGQFSISPGLTYMRLKPGASVAVLAQVLSRIAQPPGARPAIGISVEPVRIDRLNVLETLHPGFHARMLLLGALGVVVLLIAAINFVNLQTVCSTLRAREVAIRGLSGASRHTLIVQFLGEALIYTLVAALLAVALAEWLLPRVNVFLDTGATLDYRHEPGLIAVLVGVTLIIGTLAGTWPAFVISGFRAVTVLRGVVAAGGGSARQGLVALQFALLIGLAICAGVVYRQREFAVHDALRMNHDQVLMIYAPQAGAFADEVRRLPGVRAVTRAGLPFLGTSLSGQPRALSVTSGKNRSGKDVSINTINVDFDLFDFYGIRPLAGHLPAVGAPRIPDAEYVVLNATAARKYELGPPAQAVGKTVPLGTPDSPAAPDRPVQSTVLAVVPDFSLNSIAEAVPPIAYFQQKDENGLAVLNVRLTGRDIPETLASIDGLWKSTGHSAPLLRFFLDEQMQRIYRSVLRQSQAFGICALIAMALSCIGLFALTAATAQRRTREIGIRKALGADTNDVVRLLLWQFSKPVVWASLLAWPAAAYAMRRWLAGFAYHIDLPIWLFPAAAVGALLIALATVTTQSVLVARARPVAALRYE